MRTEVYLKQLVTFVVDEAHCIIKCYVQYIHKHQLHANNHYRGDYMYILQEGVLPTWRSV